MSNTTLTIAELPAFQAFCASRGWRLATTLPDNSEVLRMRKDTERDRLIVARKKDGVLTVHGHSARMLAKYRRAPALRPAVGQTAPGQGVGRVEAA